MLIPKLSKLLGTSPEDYAVWAKDRGITKVDVSFGAYNYKGNYTVYASLSKDKRMIFLCRHTVSEVSTQLEKVVNEKSALEVAIINAEKLKEQGLSVTINGKTVDEARFVLNWYKADIEILEQR